MSRRRIVVLGAGRVGALIARDLSEDSDLRVVVADVDDSALDRVSARADVEVVRADLAAREEVVKLASGASVVVGAVPGSMARGVVDGAIAAGSPLVDISFGPGDPLAMHDVARDAGVPVVVDCGVAPGISNLLVGRAAHDFDRLFSVEIEVGGLPFRRRRPFEYVSVFSPTDVIEEYVRPCRMRVGGREVVVPALTDVSCVELEEVGTLEAFNTDGLRSLLSTIDAPDMRERTLRYPGHAERVRLLRDLGFFGDRPVETVDGVRVIPRRLTEALVFDAWRRRDDDEEFTALRVRVTAERAGCAVERVWELFDRTDPVSGETSMARATGFPCAIVARELAFERWAEPGVHAPEHLASDDALFETVMRELERRGVTLRSESVGD